MFYLVDREVMQSEDEVIKSLFVEAFQSRESYVETVMDEFDETDRIEEKMSSGTVLDVPGYVYDDDDRENSGHNTTASTNKVFDIDASLVEISELVAGLDPVDMTKYVKLFEKDGESRVGIYNSRIKALAKRKSFPLSPFPPVKLYPKEVKSGINSILSCRPGQHCGWLLYAHQNSKQHNSEARIKILEVLGKEDLPHVGLLLMRKNTTVISGISGFSKSSPSLPLTQSGPP